MDLSDRRRSRKIHEFYRIFFLQWKNQRPQSIEFKNKPDPRQIYLTDRRISKRRKHELQFQWGGEEKQKNKQMAKIERKELKWRKKLGAIWVGA